MELAVGNIVEGKVTGITKFGAFIALPGNRTGMVHISEVSNTYVKDINEVLKENQEVKVKIVSIDENGRINLSIKRAVEQQRPQQQKFQQQQKPYRSNTPNPKRASGAPAPVELSFEDKLKQFMQDSNNRMSDLKYVEKKNTSRRGRR